MNINELQSILQKLTNTKVTQSEIAAILGKERSNINAKAKRGTELKYSDIQKIEKYFNISLSSAKMQNSVSETYNKNSQPAGFVRLKYFPDIYLSAEYDLSVKNVNYETVIIDERFLQSETGRLINPETCKIVHISGNSMRPEYQHGDRVIIDEADKNFTDGQIYAFNYEGQCFIKEINRAAGRIKCIPVNKEYEPFFINSINSLNIFGRLLPRIRL